MSRPMYYLPPIDPWTNRPFGRPPWIDDIIAKYTSPFHTRYEAPLREWFRYPTPYGLISAVVYKSDIDVDRP